MSLSFGLNPWLLVLCSMAAGGMAYWLYRRTTPELSSGKRLLLGMLRFVSLALILFLLFEPVLRLIEREEKPGILAVLVDNSQSLLMTSNEDSSVVSIRERVRELLDHLPATVRDAEIHVYTFDSDLNAEGADRIEVDSLTFAGSRTNISRAFEQLEERLREDNLRGALLLSDGQYNTGRNPLYIADRYPVPIYTAVLGDTSRHRDVLVRRVMTNDISYVDTELPVQVGLRAEGYGGTPAMVTLSEDGQALASQRVELPEGSAEITVDLSITAQEEGLHRYTVSVSRLDGEITYRNNVESFTVRVLSNKRQILMVAAAPGPDVSSIRQLLEHDPSFELDSYVQKSPGVFYEGAMPTTLDEFDVIVLAGYPGRGAAPEDMERLARAADSGTPIFFVFTRDTHLQFVSQHFKDVLPAVPERIRGGFVEASVSLAPDASRHPLMNIPDASPELWLQLPPLVYSQTRWQSSPDAQVLAHTSVRNVALDDPLFVVRRRPGNRSAALLGAGTWRWRNVPEDLSRSEELWPSLYANTIEWLSSREDDRPVRVVPVRDLFEGGESVEFMGQVYDESLNPVSNATLEVTVTDTGGTEYPYVMQPVGNGRYTLEAGTFPEGTYRFEADASVDERKLGSDDGAFAVGSLTLEYKETRANAALMRQIAQRSGGSFIDPGQIEAFTQGLGAGGAFAPVIIEREEEIELRRRYIFLALVIGLLTIEWLVRKRSGMV